MEQQKHTGFGPFSIITGKESWNDPICIFEIYCVAMLVYMSMLVYMIFARLSSPHTIELYIVSQYVNMNCYNPNMLVCKVD